MIETMTDGPDDDERDDEGWDDGDETPRRWTDIFSRSTHGYGYFVRKPYQQDVKDLVERYGGDLVWTYLGSMTGSGGDCWRAQLLDGDFVHRTGVFWKYEWGTGNGTWLSGHRAVRFICYIYGVPQPRRWPDEGRIPTYEELRDEARAARAANAGAWRWR